jgi:predicted RNase H-like nuclease (RuvC/YqgF family)
MNVKVLLSVLVFFAGVSVAGGVLAGNELSPEQWARAREAARQLTPPVDFDALMKEVDQLGVECTGDLTRKARIIICGQRIENAKLKAENAQIEARIEATKADTEATRARIEATKADTEAIRADTEATRARIEATKARTEKLRKENAELIREIQRRIREDK